MWATPGWSEAALYSQSSPQNGLSGEGCLPAAPPVAGRLSSSFLKVNLDGTPQHSPHHCTCLQKVLPPGAGASTSCKELWKVWDVPDLQTNKWACHSFIDAGQKTQDSWVRDKGLYYSWYIRQHELHAWICFPWPPSSTGWCRVGPGRYCASKVCHSGDPELRKLPTFAPKGDITFIILLFQREALSMSVCLTSSKW